MSIAVESKEKYTLVSVTTEKLDGTVSPELKSHLVQQGGQGVKNFVIDLSQARYCDSSGLSAILVGNRISKAANGTLVICGVKDAIMKLISISQLDSILNIVPTLPEAEEFLYMEEIERGFDQ